MTTASAPIVETGGSVDGMSGLGAMVSHSTYASGPIIEVAMCRMVIDDFSDFVKDYPHRGVARDSLNYNPSEGPPDNGDGQGVDGTNGGGWYEADSYDQEGRPLGLWWCSARGGCT